MVRSPRVRGARGWCVAAFALLGTAAEPRSAAAEDDVPLPLTGRVSVKPNGRRYVVDGKQTIPAGSVIRLEANVHVVGVNGASLEVKGGLRTLGISGSRVRIEGIDFSPTVAPGGDLHFDHTDLSGCNMTHAEGTTFSGNFTMENASWSGMFSVRITNGFLRIMSVDMNSAGAVTSVRGKSSIPEGAIRSCDLGDFTLAGPCAATVRDSELKGVFTATGFTDLLVDSCDVSGSLTFAQGPEGSFSKLSLTKCNLIDGARIAFRRPAGPKTPMEKVRIDKFWFGTAGGKADMTDKQIADRIDDGADDPSVSVRAVWQNPQERKH